MSKKQTRREFLQHSSRLVAGTALAGQVAKGVEAQEERPPNILFFFPDQHRPDWIGYGPNALPISTPNLARLARTGASFNRAVVPSPVCAPSRACLASGREYDRCGVRKNAIPYPRDRYTYYGLLRDAGYHTMGVGKLDLAQGTMDWGSMHADAWGFSAMINDAGKSAGMRAYLREPVGAKGPYYEYLDSLQPPLGRICADDLAKRYSDFPDGWWGDTYPTPLDDEHYHDNWIAKNGLKLIEEAPADKPWHLVINFVGPHPSVDITRQMERTVRGPDRVVEGLPAPHHYKGALTPEEHIRTRQNYTAMIENIDGWLGRYIEMLEETGQLENTIIVYSSDHGEMLGDHARWGKSVPFQASLGVPLLAAGPGIRPGVESDALVSIMDLAATFLDYGGVERPSDMDSRSLRPLLEGRTDTHREVLLSGLLNSSEGDWRLAWDGRYKLVRDFGDEQYQLFDLEADPLETRNLASREPGRARSLREWLPEGFEEPA